jgi:dTDP-4-amino-4,6-dideoxy-D-galactose acyltransferase
MEHKHLQWDSDFFKFKIAEIKSSKYFEPESLTQTVDKLKVDGYRLIYLYVDPADVSTNELAAAKKWLLADEKTIYTLDLTGISNKNESDISVYSHNYPNDKLMSLAIQSGEWSRFRTDKNFKPDDYKVLYEEWIEKSVQGEMSDVVLIHESGGRIDGMITFSIKDNIGIIGLIGVDESARGQGVGTKLINSAINYCLTKGIKQINVATQKQNVAACRFYEKNNFKINNIVNLYHLWL